ncbi:pullulanase [Antrihabitans sp. YC2-6]|uniref:pullulanase n=1 Tax=Antrihabitans sp. YC2-6 TaxID=2799498 RepID=UPI0018F3666D|nr:pullulanase [Antrihabitans sp. YC2-6]MBJ8346463.1 pullulanase [Antrihabitans sp. YC2-6]
MGGIEYSFGTGPDDPTSWSSAPDRDLGELGAPDAVALDFDGDGLIDDAMWDSDHDLVADTAALDLDDDGEVDVFYADPTGTGIWNDAVLRPTSVAEPAAGIEWRDSSGHRHLIAAEEAATALVDYDGDGSATDAVVDTDHDLRADGILLGSTGDSGKRFDSLVVTGQPDIALVDTDGDGILDAVLDADQS